MQPTVDSRILLGAVCPCRLIPHPDGLREMDDLEPITPESTFTNAGPDDILVTIKYDSVTRFKIPGGQVGTFNTCPGCIISTHCIESEPHSLGKGYMLELVAGSNQLSLVIHVTIDIISAMPLMDGPGCRIFTERWSLSFVVGPTLIPAGLRNFSLVFLDIFLFGCAMVQILLFNLFQFP